MKKLILLTALLFCIQISYAQQGKGKGKGKSENGQKMKGKKMGEHHMGNGDHKMLRHVVLFKFKDSSSAEDIKRVEDAFAELPKKISQVKGYEWGTNNSPENLNQGFTHCFFVTFKSEEDRAIYLPHPDHKAFVDVLSPHLDKVLVVDYWVK
jgi:Stress responsive A/B Barrel Domain